MNLLTPDLCDAFPDDVKVVEPIFKNYGGCRNFSGEVTTVKCFEDNALIKELVVTDGSGKVLVIDAGGSKRRALVGDNLATKAYENGWQGFIIYGCIRDVDEIANIAVGIKALTSYPIKANTQGTGEVNIPVTFGSVTFNPGDYIYADNNGVVVSSKQLQLT